VVSETEEDVEEGDSRNRFDQFVLDSGDMERLAGQIWKTFGRRMSHTRSSGDDDENLLPSAQDPELWMLRTKV
jgi:hypothetical protein